MRERRSPPPDLALAGAASLAAIGLHARSLAFGWTGLDDTDLLVDDLPWLKQPSALWGAFTRPYLGAVDAAHAYYRPLVTLSYVLDARLGGGEPWAFHATNVVLHAATCALLLLLLRQLGAGRAAALVATLAFAAHPALANAVAWIPGRNDVLLGLLSLGAWLAFARRRTAAHLALFGLALLAKETAAVLPVVMVGHAALVEPRGGPGRRAWASLGVGWTALLAARFLAWPSRPTLEPRNVALVLTGLGRVVLPVHPAPLADLADLSVVPGVAAAILLGIAVSLAKDARRRVIALGVATFTLTLVPSLVVGGSLWLDSRLYLPAAGLAIVGAELLGATASVSLASVAVAALAAMTLAFEGAFRSEDAFAREAAEDSPHSALAHVCLGRRLQGAGDDDGAFAEYRTALDLGTAEIAHNNLGVLYMKRGDWVDAEQELRAELAINPASGVAKENLAIVLRRERDASDR